MTKGSTTAQYTTTRLKDNSIDRTMQNDEQNISLYNIEFVSKIRASEKNHKTILNPKTLWKGKTDSVFFRFGVPNAGRIGMEVFLNGEKSLSSILSVANEPFHDIKQWLENIAIASSLQQILKIVCADRELHFIYEVVGELDEKNIEEEKGLFCIYDFDKDKIFFKSVVNTKELVTALYLAILKTCSNGYNCSKSNFALQWYAFDNSIHPDGCDNWSFYNEVKSHLVEWYLYAKDRNHIPTIVEQPRINEVLQMWCDYGGAMFWGTFDGQGAGCGDANFVITNTCGELDLSSIDGLSEWYDEFDERCCVGEYGYDESKFVDWYKRGRVLAQKVREYLPDNIDLYYHDWYPSIVVERDDEYRFLDRLPMIVNNKKFALRAVDRRRAPVSALRCFNGSRRSRGELF